ncbi:MAG: alpha-ketoacid dehydrogenase subunit beta [Rhodospirillaceae bacterium]|nr:alpha-ketoacid dehydrogenase subunit beta [Rhodospirillaceae bacterium]
MPDNRNLSYAEAISEGLKEAMAHDDSVFIMGQGISDPSSYWGTTAGIIDQFGVDRVMEMPVAENGMVGIAVGAAMSGQRPVICLHRVEFSLLAIEQIVNNAAKAHYVSNGVHRSPLVIRMVVGRGWGQGPEHAQSLESVFSHFPGLKVIMPTFPDDAKGMLIAAIQDDNPVIMIENRWLHYVNGNVDEGLYLKPLDGPRVIAEGTDVTLVATSYMTLEAMRAADYQREIGCSVEVVDLRVIRPLNLEPVFESVRKTGHLVTIDSGWVTYGVGSEIVASVAENCFSSLKAPPLRLGPPDHPTPSSRGLIADYYPNDVKIIKAVERLLQLDGEKVRGLLDAAIERNKQLPIDVADPFFKGPF